MYTAQLTVYSAEFPSSVFVSTRPCYTYTCQGSAPQDHCPSHDVLLAEHTTLIEGAGRAQWSSKCTSLKEKVTVITVTEMNLHKDSNRSVTLVFSEWMGGSNCIMTLGEDPPASIYHPFGRTQFPFVGKYNCPFEWSCYKCQRPDQMKISIIKSRLITLDDLIFH